MTSIIEDADRFAALLGDLEVPRPGLLTVYARRDFLVGLAPQLLRATALGRKKLERFHETRPTVPQGFHEIRDVVSFYGDSELLDTVAEALVLVPGPVRDHVLDVAAFVGVGISSAAWTSSLSFADRDGKTRHRIVVLGPDASVRTVCHECGHVWLDARLDGEAIPSFAITAQGQEGFAAFMVARGERAVMEEYIAKRERLADACAFVWMQE